MSFLSVCLLVPFFAVMQRCLLFDKEGVFEKAEAMLRPTASRPACLVVGHPSVAHEQIVITVRQLRIS
jgi:hypothetical protein